MAISINDLVKQLSILGVVETAANGSFHDLPGSGGGGGSSNVKMFTLTANAGGPPGSGNGSALFNFDTPASGVFVQTCVVNGNPIYGYTLSSFTYPDASGVTVLVSAEYIGEGTDPNTPFPVTIGVRAEPFVAT